MCTLMKTVDGRGVQPGGYARLCRAISSVQAESDVVYVLKTMIFAAQLKRLKVKCSNRHFITGLIAT